MKISWLVVVSSLLSTSIVAHAGENRAERGKALFTVGAAAYNGGQYPEALDHFKQAYLVDHHPALLFNMAACLERLERPHDAAEELRAYLRAEPEAANRSDVESRVRALEEAQRLIDAQRLKDAPPQLLAVTPPPSKWPRKRVLAVVLGSLGGAAIVVGLGVGLGIGLRPHYPETTLGTQVVTP